LYIIVSLKIIGKRRAGSPISPILIDSVESLPVQLIVAAPKEWTVKTKGSEPVVQLTVLK